MNFNLFRLTASSVAETSSGATTQMNPTLSMLIQLLPFVLIFVVFYFFMIRPQKKKEKEIQQMRSNIENGDEIITVGGILGIVTSIKDDIIVIETGSDRSKVRIAKWAVQENLTVHDTPAE